MRSEENLPAFYINHFGCALLFFEVFFFLIAPFHKSANAAFRLQVKPEVLSYFLYLDFIFPPRRLQFCVSGMLSRRAGPFFLAVPGRGVM